MKATWRRPLAMQQWRMYRKTKHQSTTMCGSPMHPPLSSYGPSPYSAHGRPPPPDVRHVAVFNHAVAPLSHTPML